jgi:ribosomal protein L37AE/L43A
MVIQEKGFKCKKCNSTLNYIRFKESVRVCRQCGYIEKINLKEMKGGN